MTSGKKEVFRLKSEIDELKNFKYVSVNAPPNIEFEFKPILSMLDGKMVNSGGIS